MVESFGALVAITLTMLFASIQGPSGDRPRSIRDSKAFASLVNLTEGRACSPTSCRRQFFGGTTHRLKRRARSGFGRRHHCTLDDRRVAHDDAAAPLLGQHFNRHLAVGFSAAEVD